MDIDGWHVRGNVFIKGFMDYVVEVKEVQPKHAGEDVRVTIWKGMDMKIPSTMNTFQTSSRPLIL